MPTLPYFDLLLAGRKDARLEASAFQRHVHWGYWDDPAVVCSGVSEFQAASARLDRLLADRAGLRDGMSVLDAGCGFGGTLGGLARRFKGMTLLGVNIDRRQIEVARRETDAAGSRLFFVEGDACRLPVADGSIDAALAVECIFHFPSRMRFLAEAGRALKPGARLVLSDFVPSRLGNPGILGRLIERKVVEGYGELGAGWTEGSYAEMAAAAGLRVVSDEDVTANTLPTYPFLTGLIKASPQARFLLWPTRILEWLSRLGWLQYRLVCFEKPALR